MTAFITRREKQDQPALYFSKVDPQSRATSDFKLKKPAAQCSNVLFGSAGSEAI
jgi:hypothetical protein